MHSTDRAPMSFAIGELERLRDEAISNLKDDRYYAFTEALDVLKRRFPEMFEKREHHIKEGLGWMSR